MEKKELKNLKPGDCIALDNPWSDSGPDICCFVKLNRRGDPVISWPNMDGGAPVEASEITHIPDSMVKNLSRKNKRNYETAVMGMERYYPEVCT